MKASPDAGSSACGGSGVIYHDEEAQGNTLKDIDCDDDEEDNDDGAKTNAGNNGNKTQRPQRQQTQQERQPEIQTILGDSIKRGPLGLTIPPKCLAHLWRALSTPDETCISAAHT